MADVKLNFSSQWPSVQVAMVLKNPETTGGEPASWPYTRKFKHNLKYPPLAIAMGKAVSGANKYNPMIGADVDDTYVYVTDQTSSGWPAIDCVVVYALDITNAYNYKNYENAVGDVLKDTSGGVLDMRDFLLHSRAVSPMLLAVTTKTYTLSDMSLSYTSPLDYPTFQFGYVRHSDPSYPERLGIWQYAPLAGQAWPVMFSDGFTSTLGSTTIGGVLAADRGSIITLRNPAIVTNNSVNVTL